MWLLTPVMAALRRQKNKDATVQRKHVLYREFQARHDDRARSCLKKKKKREALGSTSWPQEHTSSDLKASHETLPFQVLSLLTVVLWARD